MQTTGEDYFINLQTWLRQPFENRINPATDILLNTTVIRLAKDLLRISLEGKFKLVLFFKQNILFHGNFNVRAH